MASVDPYATCPCGSGQKYKFCCQKVEAYAERAQKLIESEQYEAALKPLDEGLSKVPDNPLLLMRKALSCLHLNKLDAAKQALRVLLQGHPTHLSAWVLSTQLALETEGAVAGVAQFQQALSACPPERRGLFASLASHLGTTLAQVGVPVAALKHLELAIRLGAGNDKQTVVALQNLRANPAVSVWERNPYRLALPPVNVSNQFRESFQQALGWANEGLWSAAASAFELLAPASSALAVADRNRGLCCLWIADHEGAVASLRRYIARIGPTNYEAIDLEALCQRIDHPPITDSVEFVQLTWPIRNRDGLLAALRADKSFDEGPARSLDPDDQNDQEAPKVERFLLLDRPRIAAKPGLTRQEVPRIEAEVLVGKDVVALETYDDGRLDRLNDRFVAGAGLNIPPAHPRTKVIGREPRFLLNLSCRWRIPGGVSEGDADRLNQEQVASMIEEVWPKTTNPHLRGRTPLQAAQAGDAEIALRAAVRALEFTDEEWVELIDWDRFRAKLQLKPEPPIDPELSTIEDLHLSRLSSLPIERLDHDGVLHLYHRAKQWGLRSVMIRAARIIAEHPSLLVKGRIETTALYGDLALDAARRHNRTEAEDWIRRGRQSEPPLKRAAHALIWEMTDLQIKVMLDDPEVWVPRLAVILEKYKGNQEATSAVFLRLMDFGLVQAVVDPNHPEKVALDTRTLQYYLSRYGPRVTTSAGQLGVAAARGEIWTPESEGPARSAVWTPGSASASPPSGEKPKLILPGS